MPSSISSKTGAPSGRHRPSAEVAALGVTERDPAALSVTIVARQNEHSKRKSPARVGARAGTEATIPAAKTSALFVGYLILLAFEWLGLQQEVAPLKAIRFTTLLGYGLLFGILLQSGLRQVVRRPQARIFFAFIGITAASMLWAVVTEHAFNAIRPLVDYTVLYILTAVLIDRRSRLVALSWTLLSVCTVLVLRNLDKFGQSVRAGGFNAGYFLGDGNDLAWGMVIALPLIAYLALARHSPLARTAGLAGVGICLVAIVGTASRGGTLALAGSLLFYWGYISQRKVRGAVAVAAVALGVLVIAPTTYFDRMRTIGTYEEDSSAQSRLALWGYAFEMARDFPLGVGGGNFASAYGRYYAPVGERSTNANDAAWGQGRWLNAHSIYFKAMGEYGFVGFLMLVGLVMINIFQCLAARRVLALRSNENSIPPDWPGLVAVSCCGFAIGGIFLGGLAYPHMFFLSGLVVASTLAAEQVADRPAAIQRTTPRRRG